MKLSRLAIGFYLTLVFVSGAVLGAFGHRLYTVSPVSAKTGKNPEEWRKKAIAEYRSRLKLNDEQVVKLNAIMDETRARVREVQQRSRPEFEAIHNEQSAKVRAMLTADQQAEYEKMHKEREEKQRHSGRGPGPGF